MNKTFVSSYHPCCHPCLKTLKCIPLSKIVCSSKNQLLMVKGIFLLQVVSESFYLLQLFTLLHTRCRPATSHSPQLDSLQLNFASLLSCVFPIGDVVFAISFAYFLPCTSSFPFKVHFWAVNLVLVLTASATPSFPIQTSSNI